MNRTVSSFCDALRDSVVWSRTLRIGLPVGFMQVCINQGDAWLAGAITVGVVAKSLLSPAVSCAIAFSAAASARRSDSSA
jgi:hypothetical protein